MRWLVGLVVALLAAQAGTSPPAVQASPGFFLWAWERPEDLRFLNPRETGVAFLAATVFLRRDFVEVRPRLQPLRLSPGTALVAVVRIESLAGEGFTLDMAQRTDVARAIARAASTPGVSAVQLDYDARLSERPFYSALLRDVRKEIPEGTGLSITALASWCLGDPWLDGLPIDEAVPMLFQMGRDAASVRLHVAAGHDFRSPVCRSSLGLSTDEELARLPRGRRVYIFHPRSWTPDAASKAIGRARRMQ